jgi:hypothetical protein
MQPVWYPGDPENCLTNLPRSIMVKLSKETGFERPELEAFWEQWTFMANTEWREDPDDLCLAMDRKTFERCLVPSGGYRHTAPNLIHDRMFSFYDTNNDDLIGFTEFLHGLSYRKRKDKLRRIFDGYDIDRDGLVNRRDFLRVFRAYYVLYKQMHKDILEGLEDQVMSSTEAHQLVSSRQPISSLFGREGRVPQGDTVRHHMEGKIFHGNGDVVISDGKNGVVSENKPDTAERESILTSLFNKSDSHGIFAQNVLSPSSESVRSPDGEADPRYWSSLLNPPTRVDQLPSLLSGQARDGDDLILRNGAAEQGESLDTRGEALNGLDTENQVERSNDADVTAWLTSRDAGNEDDENRAIAADVPRRRVIPAEAFTTRIPTESQLRAQHQQIVAHSHRAALNKRSRVNARRKLMDRWKRRQFYLDEEEGAVAPDGWAEDDDILANMTGMAESSKSAQPPTMSPRSRSSSKVRFAEETDDYEIRSNPSTSSRSVPERWGGMEIPDAERDAGKEILYQVTQQAFNELLDILFKQKEDLAIEAATNKPFREQHRALFESINLEEEDSKLPSQPAQPESSTDKPKPTGDSTLDALLVTSGYTIDESLGESGPTKSEEEVKKPVEEPETADQTEQSPTDTASDDPSSSNSSWEYLDPTMPQFRPNSDAKVVSSVSETSDSPVVVSQNSSTDEKPDTEATRVDKGKSTDTKDAASSKAKKAESDMPVPIPHAILVQWKRQDVAEKEAETRGGWGTLSFDEFEEIYKTEENHANRLDYLGSWIDFCIP